MTYTTAVAKPARARRAAAAIEVLPPALAKPTSKSDTVIKLLLRTKGATAVELIAATDWQAHSLRAFLSGLRKKGRAIVREPRKSGEAAYHMVVAVAADEQPTIHPGAAVEPDSAGLTSAADAEA